MQPRLRLTVRTQAKILSLENLALYTVLYFVPINAHATCNHAQSIASNGDQKEDKTALTTYSRHGEFQYISVSERQRSRPCGHNLRVPFLRTVLPPEVERALEPWRPTARQKRSYLHHQGEFQHQRFTFRSVLDSDHGSVVRIFVDQS